MTIPATLQTALQSGNVVPFVGLGVSLGVTSDCFPTWEGLLSEIAEQLDGEGKKDDSQLVTLFLQKSEIFKAAAEGFAALGRSRFNSFMKDRFGKAKPEQADLTVPKAIWNLGQKLVITTNYDDVLRWAAPEAALVCNDQTAEVSQIAAGTDDRIVWHIHGHHSRADTLVLAPSQYDQLYGEDFRSSVHAAALQQLRNVVANQTLLFIGFGLGDIYLMGLLRDLLQQFNGNIAPSFAVGMRIASEAERIWSEFNIQTLAVDDYGTSLHSLLAELSTASQGVTVESCV